MSNIALKVKGLGKQYRFSNEGAGTFYRYKSLRDTLGGFLREPVRSLTGTRQPLSDANSFWALKDVEFDVKRGEVVGIIGRNGAGKSTLLKILSRITKPTTGQVEVYGRVGSLLEVGTGFHPELSGRENIFLNGAILGMTGAEVRAKFDEIVDFSEIEKFIDSPVKQYSSGMYMRLAFAVAAHLEPEILIVDEVLAVGDAAFQDKCVGKMRDVANQGRTVLFVSHNMAAIRDLCHSAVVLAGGRSVTYANVESAMDDYLAGSKLHDALPTPRRTTSIAPVIQMCTADKAVYNVAESKTFVVKVLQHAKVHVGLDVHLEIWDAAGMHVLTVASRFVQMMTSPSADASVRFVVRGPWLAPGVYSVLVRALYGVVYDTLEDACRFVVEEVYPYPGLLSKQDLFNRVTVPEFSCSVD